MKLWPFLLASTCALTWQPSHGPTAHAPSGVGIDTLAVRGVLRAVNALRAKGCYCPDGEWFGPTTALRVDERLNHAAQSHAEDMQRRNYFSHTNPEGDDAGHRARKAGYPWSSIGENIAWGQPTAESVVESWRNSRGHCANMMNPTYQHIGIGKAGVYWAQVFGTPERQPHPPRRH